MPISLTVSNESADLVLADLQRLFPSLLAGTALPPMQEQPNRDPAPVEPKERKTRTKKTEELPPENVKEVKTEDKGEPADAAADTSKSESTAQEIQPSSAKTADALQVPDIEDLRARLKTLGATEGFGTDKVFEVLGKYGAKNASTVPEDKRAACIAEIDELLKGGK